MPKLEQKYDISRLGSKSESKSKRKMKHGIPSFGKDFKSDDPGWGQIHIEGSTRKYKNPE